jgi:hypothetical protein
MQNIGIAFSDLEFDALLVLEGQITTFLASDSCPASISLFFFISCVIYFLLTLLWMIPTLRSGFGKDTCGVVRLIVHYGLISISTASIVYFMALSRNVLSRLANISMTTYGSHTANRLGLPLSLLTIATIPPNHIHAQLTFRHRMNLKRIPLLPLRASKCVPSQFPNSAER